MVRVFDALREKNKFIRFLVNAQKTAWYPVLFAALCVIGGTNNHTVYVPVLWILTAFILFSVLFSDDNKVFLPPLMMIFFSLGCDTSGDAFLESNGDMLAFMDDGALKHIIAIATVCVGSFVIRLVADGSVARAFKRRRLFTWSILAMDIAFLANGLFSPVYDIKNLGYGAFLAMGFTVVYFLVAGMIEKSNDPITYACYTMLATAYVALAQIMTVAIKLHIKGALFIFHPQKEAYFLNRNQLTLGWGVSTVIAAVFVLGIPTAMYLAKNRKFSLLSFVSPILFIMGTLVINARAAMLVGILAFIICGVICCFSGKNKKRIRVYLSACALLSVCAVVCVHLFVIRLDQIFADVVHLLRLDTSLAQSDRIALWQNGISDFVSSPILGVGFNDGAYISDVRRENFFSNMYHCVLVQIPGAMGAVGCVAFVFHIFDLIKLFIKKFSIDKLLLMTVPFMILAMSLVDNFFFYLHFQIFYAVFLAIAESLLYKEQQ